MSTSTVTTPTKPKQTKQHKQSHNAYGRSIYNTNHPCYKCEDRKELCSKGCIKLCSYKLAQPKQSTYKQIKTVTNRTQPIYISDTARVSKNTIYMENKKKVKPPKQRKLLYSDRGNL